MLTSDQIFLTITQIVHGTHSLDKEFWINLEKFKGYFVQPEQLSPSQNYNSESS